MFYSRRNLVFLAVLAFAVAVAVLLSQMGATAPLLAVVGIARPTAGECVAADADSVVVCRLEHRVGARPSTYEQVVVRSTSEAPPQFAARTWTVADSAEWDRARDSVHRALARWGGRRVRCRPPRSHPVLLHDDRRQFRGYMMRFVASRLPVVYNDAASIQWQLSVIATTDGSLNCSARNKPRYRLIGPAEWLRRQLHP